MTCIVGMVSQGRVIMAGDSAGVAGLNISIRKDEKVFKVGEFLIGCTSSYRMLQLLRFSFTPPPVGEKDIYEYMCTEFVKAVRDCFQKNGFHKKETDGEERGGSFLVGYQARLFHVENDFQVGENLCRYDAIGCGASFALGALTALRKTAVDDITAIKFAMSAAAYHSAGVHEPFIYRQTGEPFDDES